MGRKPTKAQQEAVLRAVKEKFAAWVEGDHGPVLMDFDWFHDEPWPHVVWEGGPYEWPLLVTGGGTDEEFGGTYEAVKVEGVFLEPTTGYALGIYREEA